MEKILTKFKDADWPMKRDVSPPEWMSIDEESKKTTNQAESIDTSENENDTIETSSQLSESIASMNENEIVTSPSKNSLVNEATAPFNDSEILETKNMDVVEAHHGNNEQIAAEVTLNKEDEKQTTEESTKLSENVVASSNISAKTDDTSFPSYKGIIEIEDIAPSIFTTIQTLFKVMNHPQKTAKMCELCLDCIASLASNGYISGQVGGSCNQYSSNFRNEKEDEESKVQEKVVESQVSKKSTEEEIHEEKDEKISFFQFIVENITKCSESSADNVQIAMSKALLAMTISSKCGIHEAEMLTVVRSVFHVYLVSKSENSKSIAKATLIDMLRSIFSRLETYSSVCKSNDTMDKSDKASNHRVPVTEDSVNSDFVSQFHKDGFLLFRALCKLSAKSLPGEDSASSFSNTPKILQPFSTTVDPLAMQSKVLSLQLILFIFEQCGDAFRKGEKFIYAVQHYLCVSLLKNCTSSHKKVAYHSLKLFLALVSTLFPQS